MNRSTKMFQNTDPANQTGFSKVKKYDKMKILRKYLLIIFNKFFNIKYIVSRTKIKINI